MRKVNGKGERQDGRRRRERDLARKSGVLEGGEGGLISILKQCSCQ